MGRSEGKVSPFEGWRSGTDSKGRDKQGTQGYSGPAGSKGNILMTGSRGSVYVQAEVSVQSVRTSTERDHRPRTERATHTTTTRAQGRAMIKG